MVVLIVLFYLSFLDVTIISSSFDFFDLFQLVFLEHRFDVFDFFYGVMVLYVYILERSNLMDIPVCSVKNYPHFINCCFFGLQIDMEKRRD